MGWVRVGLGSGQGGFWRSLHASHILQPLDVGVFSVYNHWHSEWVYDATVSGYERITKDDFLGAIAQIRQRSFKPSTIKVGFRLTGLWLINPNIVLEGLVDSVEEDFGFNTPSPPSSITSGAKVHQILVHQRLLSV